MSCAYSQTFDNARGGKLMLSPPLADVGRASAGLWAEKWDVCSHLDPNGVVCLITSGGSVQVADGQLYFGTMNLFLVDLLLTFVTCGAAPELDETYCEAVNSENQLVQVAALLGALRATTILRADRVDAFGVSGTDIDTLWG